MTDVLPNTRCPVSVVIPTWARGTMVLAAIEKIKQCNPPPDEIIIHVDQSDGSVERKIAELHPDVTLISSTSRIGPGAGRDLCLKRCRNEIAVSFDDDSYPQDRDFIETCYRLFAAHPHVAVVAASIWQRNEPEKPRTQSIMRTVNFIGCGYGIRVAAYRSIRGMLPRPVAYGMEEADTALQLHCAGWEILCCGDLRVFHDTELTHHGSPSLLAGRIQNIALFGFLHYPASFAPVTVGQVISLVIYCIRKRRLGGILSGLAAIPLDLYRNRQHRRPVASEALVKYLWLRRTAEH
jgi:GT2 family glycosyltransferase